MCTRYVICRGQFNLLTVIYCVFIFILSVLSFNYVQIFGVYLKLCYINKVGLDLPIFMSHVKESNLLVMCMNK